MEKLHFDFPRKKELRASFGVMVTDYFAKSTAGMTFEATGLVVTGPSRVGKTKEIEALLKEFNSEELELPGGQKAKVISCVLIKCRTWKDLGVTVLRALHFPVKSSLSQAMIWSLVANQLELQGVIGIHFDECQHVFHDKNQVANDVFIDHFKALMKDPEWPLMLILAGVDELTNFLNADTVSAEQFRPLLTVNSFRPVDIEAAKDKQILADLIDGFCLHAGVDGSSVLNLDIMRRLTFTANTRWGLIIQMLKLALLDCRALDGKVLTSQNLSRAFAKRFHLDEDYTPFNVSDYTSAFDPMRLSARVDDIDGRG
jgi:hypothetical protein